MIKPVSLLPFNTFGIESHAPQLIRIQDTAQLDDLLPVDPDTIFILGGGSNILLTRDLELPVWKNEITGIKVWKEEDGSVIVRAGGGESWHDLVKWSIEHDLGGIENLSLIPGTVGAAPIQNIGAYGVELKDVFHHLEAYELGSGKKVLFEPQDCGFNYRDSFFKREGKGQFFVTYVYLRLSRAPHTLNLSYGDIARILEEKGVGQPGIKDVSDAVIAIRSAKLPDPRLLGNAGSFFKNPELPAAHLDRLKQEHPSPVYYELPDGRIKVPAGWLIEQCGWKGKRQGDAGCYEKQALVLVNYGKATGEVLYQMAMAIRESVQQRFGIALETEVNIL